MALPPPLKLKKTPAGDSLVKTRKLIQKLEDNPRLRRAVMAAIKAMGLPPPDQKGA